MSKCEEETIACGECGHEQPFTIWQSINVSMDPGLEERLVNGELTTFECEKCGKSVNVVYPLLYHDMERVLMIRLDPTYSPEDDEEMSGDDLLSGMMQRYTMRVVLTMNDLLDKIYVFKAGLDDRTVEMFKILLKKQLEMSQELEECELYFAGIEEQDGGRQMYFVLVTEEGLKEVTHPGMWERYEQVSEVFAPGLPDDEAERGRWLCVDESYIRSLGFDLDDIISS